ncbi:MAG: MarR family transcriptional regulator [Methanobacteriaceae archaeon]|nr:MarR family transcriptional regulator [Methanobacteriaceae archaeon]
MIEIRLIKQTNGKEIVKEYEEIYGSIDKLQRVFKNDPENMKLYTDLEDWEYFIKHPNEKVEDGRTLFTEEINLGSLELMLLSFIKDKNPKSIRELARLVHKDISSVQPKVKNLEKQGFITFKNGSKNRKIPTLNYDTISIKI